MASDYSLMELMRLIEEEAEREVKMFKELEEELKRTIEELKTMLSKTIENALPEVAGVKKKPLKVKREKISGEEVLVI